ncbi:MAG: NAD(P)-dependent oxidoreductase [Candidatus Saccharimonadales bacterium]
MRVLVFGSSGFVGRYVTESLKDSGHEAIDSNMDGRVDLIDEKQVLLCILRYQPEVVISCAGIIENSPKAYQNIIFSTNIIKAASNKGLDIRRIIITGSAAEYGTVASYDEAVSESHSLSATSDYGKSKIEETKQALEYAKVHNLDCVVVRLFNPIGRGMGEKFLITRIMSQLEQLALHERDEIEIGRLDSCRDYIDIRDVAHAITLLAEVKTTGKVYNIGSGRPTSNRQVVDQLIDTCKVSPQPSIRETMSEPEPIYASKADIETLHKDTGWSPKYSLSETIKEICR